MPPTPEKSDVIVGTGLVPPAPYAGWSPLPDQVAPVPQPQIYPACCPILPPSCGPCATGKCVVPAQQPVIPVPVYQEIQKKDRIVEIPQTLLKDKVIPRLYHQEVFYEVPKLSVQFRPRLITVPKVEFKEKLIDVNVPVGYNYRMVPKWEIREVPKIIPKYIGPPETIYIEVPQVKVVDKMVEKEVPVYVGEKLVPKEVIEEDAVEVVEYKYVEKEEEVPVFKYKPVFDVQVDIPPPLIVPVPVEPREVRLTPERMTLAEWKRVKLGGGTRLCDEAGPCGPRPENPCPCCAGPGTCVQCCHPGRACSPGGLCGALSRCDLKDACRCSD